VNILNKLKSSGAWAGLCVAGSVFWSRTAAAEVTLFQENGWTFSFDGRVNAFLSVGRGDDFPVPTPDENVGGPHGVMGRNAAGGLGVADVGWPSSYQDDADNKYFAMRVRSGMFGNILGFGLARQVSESTTIKGYVSIWSTVESVARDKWAPINAEAREGHLTAVGPWGSARVGRSLGWLGRTSYEINSRYGHGYGVGLPCTDALGPACGHIGTGVLFPGYSAGIAYSTPSLGGLQLHVGVYDPIVFSTTSDNWSHATFARPEGSITFDTPLGTAGSFKIGVEGLYQPVGRLRSDTNADDPMAPPIKKDETTSVWGASGGARIELGPARLGISAFRGRGVGLGFAGQRSTATADDDAANAPPGGITYELRTFTGYHAQAGLVIGDVHFALGYGSGLVDQLEVDKRNPKLSVFRAQTGISAAVYYHASDSIVLGLDYFRYMATWYGAPVVNADMQPTGERFAGETQNLNFVNAGVTYHW
jgi:hypothetical protein